MFLPGLVPALGIVVGVARRKDRYRRNGGLRPGIWVLNLAAGYGW